MRHSVISGIALLLIALPIEGRGVETSDLSNCTDTTRECTVASAMGYFDALQKADGSKVRLAPNVRRTQNGGKLVEEGADLLRQHIGLERLTGRRNLRLVVDEGKHDVFAFWLTGTSIPKTPSSHVAERVKVDHGLITEIEVFWVQDERTLAAVESGWPDETPPEGPLPSLPPKNADAKRNLLVCTDSSRACLIAVAKTYLDALVAADGSKTRFAADVRRTQNGGHLQEGEPTLRAAVARERLVLRRNFRIYADERGGQVVAVWVTGSNNPAPSTAHVIERLKIVMGQISEIEVFYPRDEGTLDGQSGWPDEQG